MSQIITLYDFNDVDPSTMKVEHQLEVPGWYPLDIEYSFNYNGRDNHLCWRVLGTTHVFKIDKNVIDKVHNGNIREHFTRTLERFREHYIKWQELGYPKEWKEKYMKIFGSRISE